MQYTVEPVTKSTQEDMLDFLKEREDYCLFLLNNFEQYGHRLKDAPYSGNYKLIRSSKGVAGVFMLTKKGVLHINSNVHEPVYDVVIEACQQEAIPLKGLIGDWNFCGPFWEHLKSRQIITNERFASKEILYSMELSSVGFPVQSPVRLLSTADLKPWRQLRLAFLSEGGLPNLLTEEQMTAMFLEKVAKHITWGYFLNDQLVSVADLNAKALDLGQVGGVFTAPQNRRQGYSIAVMQQLFRDSKLLHNIRKLIIFTSPENVSAQNLYSSLGAKQQGHFALLFSH